MARFSGKNRRESTIIRDNEVHQVYHDLCIELGSMSQFVSKAIPLGLITLLSGRLL